MDNTIHWINLYRVDNPVSFPNIYPLDSDLSSGWRYLTFEQPGPEDNRFDSCWDNSDFSSVPPVTLTSEKTSFLRIQRVQVVQMLHSTILGWQTHYKAAMLGFNTIAFFLEESTRK